MGDARLLIFRRAHTTVHWKETSRVMWQTIPQAHVGSAEGPPGLVV